MDIFVYSDESGVFDKSHNQFYIYGGIVFLSKEEKDTASRKYIHVERSIRKNRGIERDTEVKASILQGKDKSSLYRSMNDIIKFGVVVDQQSLRDSVYNDKKTKQRYLDYAFKRGIKYCFQHLINQQRIDPNAVNDIYFMADEHSTATNGRYELRESLEQEFKLGVHIHDWKGYLPPLFQGMNTVHMKFCDSSSTTLVRAADIVANSIYHKVMKNEDLHIIKNDLYILHLP